MRFWTSAARRNCRSIWLNEVQEVYRLQGVTINDKHIEIIVRQMPPQGAITDRPTPRSCGANRSTSLFEEENSRWTRWAASPRKRNRCCWDHQASLETESFPSARPRSRHHAQCCGAATLAKGRLLHGFKENVIMGHIIPAGTGYDYHRKVQFSRWSRLKRNRRQSRF